MKRKILSFLAAGLLCAATAAQAQLPLYTTMYVFGDSLSDAGNFQSPVNNAVVQSAPVTNPVGGTNPGKVWAMNNAVAGFFNMTPSRLNGNDYAYAYARTGVQTTADSLPAPLNQLTVLGLQNQVAYYLVQHPQANSQALYVIWAGSNDILNFLTSPNPTPQGAAQMVNAGMVNILNAIDTLYYKGARNFLVIGVPDISQTPISAPNAPAAFRPALIGAITGNNAVQLQRICYSWDNTLFSPTPGPSTGPLAYLKAIHPDMTIYTWDPRSLTPILQNPASAGFPANIPTPPFGTFPNNQVAAVLYPAGTNPDNFLFWNFIHPTSKAQTLIAQAIYTNSQPIK